MKVSDLLVENGKRIETGLRSVDSIVENFSKPSLSSFEDRLPISAAESCWETSHNPTRISRTFLFSDSRKLKYFVNEMISYQESRHHHAKITIFELSVSIETYTHSVNNITNQDLKLAKFADEIYEDTRYFVL